MGILDFLKNINNAEGSRMLTRRTYKAYVKKAHRGGVQTDDPPHYMGLYGALGNWKNTRGIPIVEVSMWAELAPFLAMNEEDSIEAIAEYIVYLDRDRYSENLNISQLSSLINETVYSVKGEAREMVLAGVISQVGWCNLLQSEIRGQLEREAQEMYS